VRVGANQPSAFLSSTDEAFGAMVRVQELRIRQELTGPQPGNDAAVRIRKHRALDGPKTSILQGYVPARPLRLDPSNQLNEVSARDIVEMQVVYRADLRSHGTTSLTSHPPRTPRVIFVTKPRTRRDHLPSGRSRT
jgi:hypothetical protein